MKKSKKPEITPEQLLGDYNKIMEFVNKLEGQDLTNINLKELEDQPEQIKKEINQIQKDFKDKYKEHLSEGDLEKFKTDLDSKE